MKTAHWSKVTKSISTKYGLNWKESKKVYDKLKSQENRKPSLRMVTALPKVLPKSVRTPKPEKPAKIVKTAIPEKQALPAGISYAPKREKPVPAPVPRRQGARNEFQKMLRARGLPVKAISESLTGFTGVKAWRNPKIQEKLADTLKTAFGQIRKFGVIKPKTLDKLEGIMVGIVGKDKYLDWHGKMFLKSMYGVPVK